MAKQTPRSEADELTAAPPKGRSRARTRAAKPAPENPQPAAVETPAPEAADTFAARPGEGPASRSMASEPSEEDIRLRAYQRYLQRGGGHGMDFDDWLEAERELRGRQHQTTK